MENLLYKVFDIALRVFLWFTGIFFILGGLFFSPTASLAIKFFILLGGILMLPPVIIWVRTKLNGKVKGYAVATIGLIVSILAMANVPSPTSEQVAQAPTPSKPATLLATQTTPTLANKTASVVAPVAIDPTSTVTPPATTPSQYDTSCKVVGISDGDTLTCLTDTKSQVKVRLNQIDAPEKDQAFGTAAKQALSGYVFGKSVNLKTSGTDKYGRTIAEVFVGDKNINKAMVADGYAWAYREYMKDKEYATLEASARSSTKGLWSEPSPIYPSDFRRGKRGEATAPVQTQQITQQVEQKAIADSGGTCGSKRYCKEMATCAEARHYLNDCGVSRLDRDGDGVPCESICR